MSFKDRWTSAAPPIIKGGVGAFKWAAARLRGSTSPLMVGKPAPEPAQPTKQAVLAPGLIAAIHRRIEQHAQQGYVSAADVIALHEAHGIGLTEDRNRFEELEYQYAAACRRLDALFPEIVPPAPEPEPEAPAKPRHFPRLRDLLGGGDNETRH